MTEPGRAAAVRAGYPEATRTGRGGSGRPVRAPAVATLAGLVGLVAACVPDDPLPTPELEDAVLDAVVDSIPFAIRYTWGGGEERDYTTVLSTEALPSLDEGASGLGYGEEPRAISAGVHPLDWLERQREKPHVLGLCRTSESPGACRAGAATMVARLSRPSFSGLDVARVEMILQRQVGDLPTPWGQVGPFRVVLTLRLEENPDGTWAIQYLRMVEMGI